MDEWFFTCQMRRAALLVACLLPRKQMALSLLLSQTIQRHKTRGTLAVGPKSDNPSTLTASVRWHRTLKICRSWVRSGCMPVCLSADPRTKDSAGDSHLVQSEQGQWLERENTWGRLWACNGLLLGMNSQKDEIQLLLWRYFLSPSQTPFSARPGNCSRPTRSHSWDAPSEVSAGAEEIKQELEISNKLGITWF